MAFSILCTPDGEIIGLVDAARGMSGLKVGNNLKNIVDSGSEQKVDLFISKIAKEKTAYNWEMNISYEEHIHTFLFSGILVEDKILIIAASSIEDLHTYYNILIEIDNEQINTFRRALKEAARTSQSGSKRIHGIHNELMRLNNELSTMQRKIAKKNQELERLVDLKNQFLGMLAHDLRNPLGAIQMASEYVRTSASERLDETEVEFLAQIENYTDYMRNLVEEALDLSAIESGRVQLEKEVTSLSTLVEEVLTMLKPIAEKKSIQIEVEEDGKQEKIRIDKDKIRQVIQNLVSNAIKYSYPRSQVLVRIIYEEDEVIVEVVDEGQGIPQKEIASLFKPFTKTSVKATGGEKSTGLGLAISKRIVDEHNGKIWATSKVGVGSQFHFSLPKKEAPS